MREDKRCLPFWQGFRVTDLQVEEQVVRVQLHPSDLADLRCGRCGETAQGLHERVHRWIRDLPMLGRTVWLQVQLRRVCCGQCGTRMQQVGWLDRHARLTKRLTEAVALWCAKLPVKHVAEMFGLHWTTVRETVYLMAEQLKSLWNASCPWQWRRLWRDWLAQANESQIPALKLFYGSPRVAGQLRLEGRNVGRRRVARLMRQAGLQGRSARLYRHSKVLQRAFYAGVPYLPESASTQRQDQVWVGDVTYLKVAGKWRYMAAVIDKHSRRIVGWSLGARRDAALTREALVRSAQRRRVRPGVVFQTGALSSLTTSSGTS